jgi:hypothetical protein
MPQLTEQEHFVLLKAAEVWNEYAKLESVHEDETNELKLYIHQIQYLIARRVARRANPEVWN